MSLVKKIGIAAGVLVAVIAGALFWLHGNIDGLIRDAIGKYGSEMTQAKVSVGKVKINALDGEGGIYDLFIGNPKGFKTSHAMKVSEFSVAVDPATVTGKVITIKKIAIVGADVIYEKGDSMTNFDAIQKNITSYVGQPAAKSSSDAKPSAKDEKKLIVNELTIKGTKAQAASMLTGGKPVAVSLPDITLRNLGKAKGGLTPAELAQEIAGAMQKQLASSVNFDSLGKLVPGGAGEAAGKSLGKVKGLF